MFLSRDTKITSMVYVVATGLKFLTLATELDAGWILNTKMDGNRD